jgi:XTP/dITP diphosphohydrolase
VRGEDDATAERVQEFLDVMRTLRRECAWKGAQTHRSLVRYLLEESHETVEAIETGDADHLCEELGDLLLQVWFHAVIAEETGAFTFDDVLRGVTDKLRRRNPHVFGNADPASAPLDAAAVDAVWQSIKATEKPREGLLDGIPASLPALHYADKVTSRLARAGRAVEPSGGDVGDRLLALVNEARTSGVDPEQALRDAVRRLEG